MGRSLAAVLRLRRASIQASRPCCARRDRATCSASPTIRAGPGFNEEQEDKLRKALEAARHRSRTPKPATRSSRSTTSTRSGAAGFGRSLAKAPTPLPSNRSAGLAKRPRRTLGGATAEAMAADYAAQGWRCDRAAMEALSQPQAGRRERSRHKGRAGALRTVARSLCASFSGIYVSRRASIRQSLPPPSPPSATPACSSPTAFASMSALCFRRRLEAPGLPSADVASHRADSHGHRDRETGRFAGPWLPAPARPTPRTSRR